MIQTLADWAETVIDIWIEKMAQLKVDNAYFHAESFYHHIISNANGDVAKIEFTFDYFLKFTDMGVGKIYYGKERPGGAVVTMANRNTIRSSRLTKQWYSKTFLLEVKKLTNMLAKEYAHRGAITIIENTDDNALKWIEHKI